MAKKLNVILDLDQTLISAEALEEFDLEKHEEKMKNFKFYDMDEYYRVFERPGLQKFLDYLFKNFNVSVWTAASKDYALFIIDKTILKKKSRKLDYVFFAYHCEISEKIKNGRKDLSILWDVYNLDGYSKKNTIIIDDLTDIHKLQPKNCIRIKPFEFLKNGSENDVAFEKVKEKLEKARIKYLKKNE